MSDPHPTVDPAVLYEHLNPMEGGHAYLSEEFRLACCLTDWPATQITPTVLQDTPEYASVEVSIIIPDRPVSIRHGSAALTEGRMRDRNGNPKGRLLEVAETRAIGRALVPLGYGTGEVLARLGVTEAQVRDILQRKADERNHRSGSRAAAAPKPIRAAQAAPADAAPPEADGLPEGAAIRDGQLRQIRALLPPYGKDEAEFARVNLKGRALADLTAVEAMTVIEWLQSAIKRQKGGQAA